MVNLLKIAGLPIEDGCRLVLLVFRSGHRMANDVEIGRFVAPRELSNIQ